MAFYFPVFQVENMAGQTNNMYQQYTAEVIKTFNLGPGDFDMTAQDFCDVFARCNFITSTSESSTSTKAPLTTQKVSSTSIKASTSTSATSSSSSSKTSSTGTSSKYFPPN